MGGGSRGVKKPKLRDYSIRATPEEIEALRKAVAARKDPLTCAILGSVMVEHELDRLLRNKFARKDDETWEILVSEKGPLSSFNSKIIAGYAFKLFDDRMHHDLNVLREIRNAFAHSRRLLDFSDPLILNKLSSARQLSAVDRRALKTDALRISTFVILCHNVAIKLINRNNKTVKARARRRLKASAVSKALIGAMDPDTAIMRARRAMTSLLLQGSSSGHTVANLPIMGGLMGLNLDDLGKSDK